MNFFTQNMLSCVFGSLLSCKHSISVVTSVQFFCFEIELYLFEVFPYYSERQRNTKQHPDKTIFFFTNERYFQSLQEVDDKIEVNNFFFKSIEIQLKSIEVFADFSNKLLFLSKTEIFFIVRTTDNQNRVHETFQHFLDIGPLVVIVDASCTCAIRFGFKLQKSFRAVSG